MEWSEWAQKWGPMAGGVAAGVGTFSAAIVALFKERFIARIWHPLLEPRILQSPPDCHTTKRGVFHAYWFCIWIENKGTTRAEKVQVYAAELGREQANGEYRAEDRFLPMYLTWAAQDNMPERTVAAGISPKMGQHCNLGSIVHPTAPWRIQTLIPANETWLELALQFEANAYFHIWGKGTYRLKIQIVAANAEPVTWIIQITIKGTWHDDLKSMLADGVGFKVFKG